MASSETFSANPRIYNVKASIGQGSFGCVFKVEDKAGNLYHVKKVDLSRVAEAVDAEQRRELREKEMNEGKLMKTLSPNPNVVRVYDYFEDDDVFHIAMELCSEGTLREALNKKRENGEWFDESLIINWLVQLVSVLKHCHDNRILHRDIKPENIFLADGGRSVKLGDFGIATVLKPWESHTDTMVGTPMYLPPEMWKEGHYSCKSEVWALGCLMYELMAQKLPYEAASMPRLMSAIMNPQPVEPLPTDRYSAKLREMVVKTMLCKSETERPSMAEILSEATVLQGCGRL